MKESLGPSWQCGRGAIFGPWHSLNTVIWISYISFLNSPNKFWQKMASVSIGNLFRTSWPFWCVSLFASKSSLRVFFIYFVLANWKSKVSRFFTTSWKWRVWLVCVCIHLRGSPQRTYIVYIDVSFPPTSSLSEWVAPTGGSYRLSYCVYAAQANWVRPSVFPSRAASCVGLISPCGWLFLFIRDTRESRRGDS